MDESNREIQTNRFSKKDQDHLRQAALLYEAIASENYVQASLIDILKDEINKGYYIVERLSKIASLVSGCAERWGEIDDEDWVEALALIYKGGWPNVDHWLGCNKPEHLRYV